MAQEELPGREYQQEIAGQKLSDLEQNYGNKINEYVDKMEACTAAENKVGSAEEALYEAYRKADRAMYQDMETYNKAMKECEKAEEAVKAAEAEQSNAEAALESAAEEAAAAEEALAEKKRQMEEARPNDKTYVVSMAQISCSCGMRGSYLSLPESHGVFIKTIPQILVNDNLKDKNVINFGGCKSKENPSTIAAAEEAARLAQEEAKKNRGFFDKVVDFFFKPKEIKVDDSLLEQCMGECISVLPEPNPWSKEKEKVEINGSAPLLRRGELVCNYGGIIIIETSGQPE